MPKEAHAEPGSRLLIGDRTFEFSDGTRQVTEEEAAVLSDYDGPLKVEITETKKKSGGNK